MSEIIKCQRQEQDSNTCDFIFNGEVFYRTYLESDVSNEQLRSTFEFLYLKGIGKGIEQLADNFMKVKV